MVTKAILTEQIYRILQGGFPSIRSRVGKAEIELAISDVANKLLKTEVLSLNYTLDGGTVVDGAAIATYENIAVTRSLNYGGIITAEFLLPASPLMMPEGIGVYEVYPSGMPHLSLNYIPSGSMKYWVKNRYVSPLHNRLFTVNGKKVTIYDDWFGVGYNEVDVQLVISDISSMSENEPLPIPADFREEIIARVLAIFTQESDTNRRETEQPSPSKRS